jgi:hypothetical protein
MKVVLTNLSNKLYENSRFRLNDSARRFGIEEIYSYDFEDIKASSFYSSNKELLDQPRGMGFWSWKPYIILQAIQKLSDGDLVIYADAGLEIIADLAPVLGICNEQQPIMLFANGNLINSSWTKRDCFILIDCDSEEYWNSLQCDAAFLLFKKSAASCQFLDKWLKYCLDKRIISDQPNVLGKKNLPGFIDHRHDQSIISLLAYKHKLTLHRMPTQFGNHYKAPDYRIPGEFNCINQYKQRQVRFYSKYPYYNSPYFQLLNHHRSKEMEEKNEELGLIKIKNMIKKQWRKLRRSSNQ